MGGFEVGKSWGGGSECRGISLLGTRENQQLLYSPSIKIINK